MPFSVDKMYLKCIETIEKFLITNNEEQLYAFAIDADLICFGSVQQHDKVIKIYQNDWEKKSRLFHQWNDLDEQDLKNVKKLLDLHVEYKGLDSKDKNQCLEIINKERRLLLEKGNPYILKNQIEDIKENTGDWVYQGYDNIEDSEGFDSELYDAHYDLSDAEQRKSKYALAINELLERIRVANVFPDNRVTNDFRIFRVEHNY